MTDNRWYPLAVATTITTTTINPKKFIKSRKKEQFSLYTLANVVVIFLATTAIIGTKGDQASTTSITSSLYNAKNITCGGTLTANRGIIQTPNFPQQFPVPIDCVWIIDASAVQTTVTPNISIVVYLTQLYALTGLTITEYMYYSEDFKVPSHHVFEVNENTVAQVAWARFTSPYLEVRFRMTTIHGTHIRALDRLLDVYGFNITYEVTDTVKQHQCNALLCRFLGHCYAEHDFSSYYCSCFKGFTGADCGVGPLCQDATNNVCQNGGTCKHIGDAAVTCLCPPGYRGNKCETPEIDEITGCNTENPDDCFKQCIFTGRDEDVCKCSLSSPSPNRGRMHFEAKVRLAGNSTIIFPSGNDNGGNTNTGNVSQRRDNSLSLQQLEKQIIRALKSYNITKMSEFEVFPTSRTSAVSGTSGTEIQFQFFGAKIDAQKVRDAINRIVERGRLGNFSLITTHFAFNQEPGLLLQSVVLNQRSAVREDSEFILSCVAQGSSKMSFRWYKNGIFINVTRATRSMWTRLLPLDSKDHYTALLGVSRATRLDEGVYTCQVADWGMQQCRSTAVHILTAPQLRVDPPSATLYRGESLRIRCLAPGSDHRYYGKLGYSWTKNGALFQSDPMLEMWEDLYPDGSILNIKNVQKSAEYTCIVSNMVAPVSRSVYVTVVDQGVVELCPAEQLFGVHWAASAAGPPVLADCPHRAEGQARRECEQRDFGKPEWQTPDFKDCIADELIDIYNEFRGLTFGYQKTNGTSVLYSCLEYTISRRKVFLPGEGGFLLALLREIADYMEITTTNTEKEIAGDIILRIIDIILQSDVSLNNQQQIKQLQDLIQIISMNRRQIITTMSTSASTIGMVTIATTNGNNIASIGGATSTLPSVSSTQQLNTFRLHTLPVNKLPFNLQIYGDQLFTDQLYMEINNIGLNENIIGRHINIDAQTTSGGGKNYTNEAHVSIVSYRNLTNFLPKMYFARNSYGTDIDYIPASRIIASWLSQAKHLTSDGQTQSGIDDVQQQRYNYNNNNNFNGNQQQQQRVPIPLEIAHVEIIFQHESPPNHEWIPMCGYDSLPTFEPTWRTDYCITENLMENITRCICPVTGTFIVLLAKRMYNTTVPNIQQQPIFVIISCGCCFLQSCITFIILLPILYTKKCSITLLKMQFCTSTSTAMAIFVLGLLKLLPNEWHGVISSMLTAVLLLGTSSLIAIALVVQSELSPQNHNNHIKSKFHKNNKKLLQKQQEQQQQLPPSTIMLTNIHVSSGVRGAIGLSWLLPILCAMCIPLIHSITKNWPINWWLEIGSFNFILFLIIQILFLIIFILLFIIIMKKLLFLLKKYDKNNATILRRIGTLNRTAIILGIKLATDIFYLIYLNTNDFITSYIFGVCSILLGFIILLCFVIKTEIKLKSEPITKMNSNKNSIEDFCSGSINSPLSFYTNQDVEKDNECIPMSRTTSIKKVPLTLITTTGSATTGTTTSSSRLANEKLPTRSIETFLSGFNDNCNKLKQQTNDIEMVSGTSTVVAPGTTGIHPASTINTKTTINNDSSRLCNFNAISKCYELVNKAKPLNVVNMQQQKHLQNEIICDATMKDWNCLQQQHQQQQQPQLNNFNENYNKYNYLIKDDNEFVGVGGLDILQGVGQDSSIIGIRSNILDLEKQRDKIMKGSILATKSDESKTIRPIIATTGGSTTATVTASPKQLHTHLVNKQDVEDLANNQSISLPPIITITASEEENDAIDGMLDRISHDLDYLLNRTTEIVPAIDPQQQQQQQQQHRRICGNNKSINNVNDDDDVDLPPPPQPPSTIVGGSHSVHDVIIEESEVE